ncbi:MAG: hypothetical protein K0S51_1090 [Bacillales bacterium]|jgi:hypothetical protein|nr:hypothetical protein [Bacillales bacterium]
MFKLFKSSTSKDDCCSIKIEEVKETEQENSEEEKCCATDKKCC